jgi:regulatory protein
VTQDRPRRPRESYAIRRARRAEIDDPEVALAAALRYLEVRARSVTETRRRLTVAGYRVELVEGAIDRLVAIGLLDDEAFARHWIESRDRARPRGETALKRELRLRGVDGTIIDAALEARRSGEYEGRPGTLVVEVPADDDGEPVDPDERAARRLLDRRRRDLDRVTDPRKRRARAYALLARNGFGPEIASRLSATVSGPASDSVDPGLDAE